MVFYYSNKKVTMTTSLWAKLKISTSTGITNNYATCIIFQRMRLTTSYSELLLGREYLTKSCFMTVIG